MIHILHGIGTITVTVLVTGIILAHDLGLLSQAPATVRVRTTPVDRDNPFAPPGNP